MSDKIQMTEEQAREILDECACTETCDFKLDETISVMKQRGYIIKSDLQQKVEEAEAMYNYWYSDKETNCEIVMDAMKIAIEALKQSHPEFKK